MNLFRTWVNHNFGFRSALRLYFAERRLLAQCPRRPEEPGPDSWPDSLRDPTAFYLRCLCYFHRGLHPLLRKHRSYFSRSRRGYGEDAFHTMWHLLVRHLRPASFLEIGVFRGQTLSLVALLQRMFSIPQDVCGISPFVPANDSVSRHPAGIDYYQDVLLNFRRWGLPPPELLRAYSTDPEAIDRIRSRPWDCIYIDGNHDWAVVKSDWEHCRAVVRTGGIIVLDDAGLHTPYSPPAIASPGFEGPSRIAAMAPSQGFREIMQVGHNRVFQRDA